MTALAGPDTTAIDGECATFVERANFFVVNSSVDYERVAGFVKTIKVMRKRIDDTFDPTIKATNTAHKQALAAKKAFSVPLDEAEYIVKVKLVDYRNEQERIRRAEEDRLRAIARKEEEDRRVAHAARLESEGAVEQAKAVLETPGPVTPIVVARTTPKVKGISTRKAWKWRVVDEAQIPRAYMLIDEKKLNDHARSMGSAASVPGIGFYSQDVMAVGA